jgi:hypothetical protein
MELVDPLRSVRVAVLGPKDAAKQKTTGTCQTVPMPSKEVLEEGLSRSLSDLTLPQSLPHGQFCTLLSARQNKKNPAFAGF